MKLPEVEIRQRDEERWYRLRNSEWWPSCTTILNRIFWRPPAGAEGAMGFGRERGTEVHRATEYICRGIAIEDLDLDESVRPRAQLFSDWKEHMKWTSLYAEQAFVSRLYRYGCTPDSVGRFKDGPVGVLEVKPERAPFAGLQLSAQAQAVKETLGLDYVPGRTVLYLSDKRIQQEAMREHSRDFAGFIAALNCFNIGIERGAWKGI